MTPAGFQAFFVGPFAAGIILPGTPENGPPPNFVSIYNSGPSPAAVLLSSDISQRASFSNFSALLEAGQSVLLETGGVGGYITGLAGPIDRFDSWAILAANGWN